MKLIKKERKGLYKNVKNVREMWRIDKNVMYVMNLKYV
jgi:hypothetical protein